MSLFRHNLPKAKDMLQVKNDRSALRRERTGKIKRSDRQINPLLYV